MTPPDLNETVDQLWPSIQDARNTGWRAIGIVAGISFVVLVLMAPLWGELIFFLTFVAILCMIGACAYGLQKIKAATAPFDEVLNNIAGLSPFSSAVARRKHVPADVLPKADRENVRDCVAGILGNYTIIRTECLFMSTDSDGDSKHPVFRGYVVSVSGLRAPDEILLVAREAGRNARALRRSARAHADPAMRHEERIKHPEIGDISIFGDGAWDEPDETSATAQRCLDVFANLSKAMANDETLLAAYFSPTRCAVSVKTKKSRGRIGGLLVTKTSLTASIDTSLSRLGRTYDLASALIDIENSAPTAPDGS